MLPISLETIERLVRRQLGVKSVQPSNRLAEDLGAESADLANIIAAAEEQFGVEIPEQEIAHIVTVSDLFAVISRNVRGT